MTLHFDFTAQETAWLNAQSQQQGLPLAEIVKRLIDAQVVATPATAPGDPSPALTDEQEAAIALLASYLETESTDDPEEIRRAEEELEEFKRNMNANRAATGERLVYP